MATGGSDNASDEIITFKCCVCVENKISREAQKYCVECQDYYCVSCSDVHKKFPLMKGHTLMDKDGFSITSLQSALPCFPTEKCPVHKTKLLDIYCKTHDEVICATCFVVKHRTCQDIISIPDEITDIYKESASADTIVKLTTAKKIAEDIKDNRQHLLKRLKENRKKTTNAIKDFSKEMEEKLKKLETESLKEVDAEYEKKENSLQNDIKGVEQYTADLDQSTDKLAKSDGNKAQEFVSVKMSENHTKTMERKGFDKQDACYMKMDFFADSRIQNCLKNINKIGRLAVYEPQTTAHTVEQQRDINVRLIEDVESCCVCGSSSNGNDERRRMEDKIQNMIEEHEQSQANALDEQRKTMDEHYLYLNRERTQQHEQEMQKLKNLFESKLKNEKEQRQDLMNRMEKANEEKMNRLLRDEKSRQEDIMNKMMEQNRRDQADLLQMQQKEMISLRAETEQLRQKMKAKEVPTDGWFSNISQAVKKRFSHKVDELQAKMQEVSTRKSSGFSQNDMEVFQKPLCLISAKGTNILKLETEVVEQISKIDWPIVVVSVVGRYRTGKSYLMNRLAGSTTGFAMGHTIKSETKGIWVWCKIHPEKLNTVLLLLDTEGLGDLCKGDQNHDNEIFTLATLLCNCLVYNMKGVFDRDAVSKLTFLTEMEKNIRFQGKSSANNSRLKLILPEFVLCLRDFFHMLYENLSEDEYLEQSLAIHKGKDDKFNDPRECIRKYFPLRRCFTLPAPGDYGVLKNLETSKFSDLSVSFNEATDRLITYIYSLEPKELLASKPINGQMFTTLATHYVNDIQHGAVPDVDEAFSAVAKIENTRAEIETLQIFANEFKDANLPLASRSFEKCYTQVQQKALRYLRKNVVHDKDGHFEQQTQIKMDSIAEKCKEENTKKIGELCQYTIDKVYQEDMQEHIEQKVYEVTGGYKAYQRDINILKADYMRDLRSYGKHEILLTWCWFLDTMKEKESQIIAADDCMSQKEKEDEIRRNEEKVKNVIEEHKKSQAHALEEQRKTMDEHFEKLSRERREQHETEMQKLTNLFESKLENEQLERRTLICKMKKENEEKIARLFTDERKRHDDNLNRMMEKQRSSYDQSLKINRAEAAILKQEQSSQERDFQRQLKQIQEKITGRREKQRHAEEENARQESIHREMENKERKRKDRWNVGRIWDATMNF